jgi:hypothetical protein
MERKNKETIYLEGVQNPAEVVTFNMSVSTDLYEKLRDGRKLTKENCDDIELYKELAICHKIQNEGEGRNIVEKMFDYESKIKKKSSQTGANEAFKDFGRSQRKTCIKNNYKLKYR